MLDGGEAPLFIARRITRFATEDIGMADPNAVQQALAAWNVYERLGSPDGELAIAQAVLYLSTAPKSIGVYRGFNKARAAAKRTGSLMPPSHILNAPTRLMKDLRYGKNYQYDPDTETGFSGANYFPDRLPRQTFYEPTSRGFEKAITERLRSWTQLRNEGAPANQERAHQGADDYAATAVVHAPQPQRACSKTSRMVSTTTPGFSIGMSWPLCV